MAKSLCASCAELLPDTEAGDGECPHCGLGYPGVGAPLRALPVQNQQPLTGKSLERWKQERANDRAFYASTASFALLGVDDSWEGIRWVGGSSSGSGQICRVELMHGGREEVPRILVNTLAKLGDGQRCSLRAHLEDLLWLVWSDEEAGLEFVQAAHRDRSPLDLWKPTTLDVNGQALEAHRITMGSSDVTVAETSDFIVSVVSAGIAGADIKLVDVDPRRYSDVSR